MCQQDFYAFFKKPVYNFRLLYAGKATQTGQDAKMHDRVWLNRRRPRPDSARIPDFQSFFEKSGQCSGLTGQPAGQTRRFFESWVNQRPKSSKIDQKPGNNRSTSPSN